MKKSEIILISLLLLVDQSVKWGMERLLETGSLTIIHNFFSLTWSENFGAAWSIFENARWFLIIVGFLSLIVLIIMKQTIPDSLGKHLSTSLLFAGILGNLIDRIVFGYVKDYLHFTFFGYSYPIFNLADVFIVCGAILLIWIIWKEEKKDGKNYRINERKGTN